MQLLTIGGTADIVDRVMQQVKDAVCSTMGPNGRLAFIASGVSTKTTKDGVTVAKSIKFDDPREELVNRVITEPSLKTDQECGDGTTTTILLTYELTRIFRNMQGFVQQREMEYLVNLVVEELTKQAIKVEVDDPRLYSMALTSSNQDAELAKTITDIYAGSKGRFPEIDLKEGIGFEDIVERTVGRVLGMAYANPAFGGQQNGGELKLDGFRAVVVDSRLMGLSRSALEHTLDMARRGLDTTQPLVLITRSIEQDVVSHILAYCEMLMRGARAMNNAAKFTALPVIVMATNFGGTLGTSMMQDLAVMLNVPMVSDVHDIDHLELGNNTSKLRLTATRSYLTEIDPVIETGILEHADHLEQELAQLSVTEKFSLRARFMEKRIRNLRGELITVLVGGETNSEIKERIDRYEDVVKAVRSGLENGILPGGGIAIMRATTEAIKRYRQWNLPQGMDWTVAQEAKKPYIEAITDMAIAQRIQLFQNTQLEELGVLYDVEKPEASLHEPHIIDLASGRIDTPENLGVYDTAYASITALKGGLQTAKLLANANTLILGDKVHSVRTPVQGM